MTWLFDKANKYIANSDWKDLALIKFCLCSIGIMIGINVADENKKKVGAAAGAVFGWTYVFLMSKFIKILVKKD